jgi:hypothetical protein
VLVAGLPILDGLPNIGLARHIATQNDIRLLDSLRYVCGVATKVLAEQTGKVEHALDVMQIECEEGMRLRGVAYVVHNELVEAMRGQNPDRVRELLNVAPELRYTTRHCEIVALSAAGDSQSVEDQLYLLTMRRENEKEYSKPFHVAPPVGDPSEVASDVQEVLRRIREVDSASAAEFDALVTDVVIMSSNAINGGTSFKAFGYLLLRERNFDPDWTNYLETLIHEAAHLYLYCLWSIDPIIIDDGGRMYKSPLRAEPRPLSGIFHAMFVLARIIRSLGKFARDPRYGEDISRMSTAYNNARNSAPLLEKFEDAFEVVRDNAVLSPLGSKLLDGCRAMVDESA